MVQPFAPRTVANLVVVLQADDVLRRHPADRRVARGHFLDVAAVGASQEPPVRNGACDIGDAAAEFREVALVIAREQAAHLVMEVVGPHGVEAPPLSLARPHHAVQLALVFRDDEGARVVVADAADELGEEVLRAVVRQRVRRVHPEPVDVVFAEPVQRVLEEERPHGTPSARRRGSRQPPTGSGAGR